MKQLHIAKTLGISEPLLSMILSGKRNVTYPLAKRLNELTRIGIEFWMEAEPSELRAAMKRINEEAVV